MRAEHEAEPRAGVRVLRETRDGAHDALVHPHRRPLDRLLRPRGLRLRGRHPAAGHRPQRARAARDARTIGPVWDGNEVWVLVAGGATFAAFPEWYATLFSGFYLPLFLILVALIVRGVGFEYRGKRRSRDVASPLGRRDLRSARCLSRRSCGASRSRTSWPASRSTRTHEFTGDLFTLLNPYGLLGGLTTLGLFVTHGAVFLALKTTGELRERARARILPVGPGHRRRRRRVPGLDAGSSAATPPRSSCPALAARSRSSVRSSRTGSGARAGRSSGPPRRSSSRWSPVRRAVPGRHAVVDSTRRTA